MANDWIKMSVNLAEKPEVFQIAAKLGLDVYNVVGRLHRIWSWFDLHTTDGHARSVTNVTLDALVSCDGFATAMMEAGWLAIDESGISLPHFDYHNGESAKQRALSTRRKQRERSSLSRSSHVKSVTNVTDEARQACDKSVTREEKRREEYIPPAPQGAKQADEHVEACPRETQDPHLTAIDAPLMARLGKIFRIPDGLQWPDIARQSYLARRAEIQPDHLAVIERYYAAKYDPTDPSDKMRCKTLHSLLENWPSEVGCALAWAESHGPLAQSSVNQATQPPTPDEWHPVWRELYQIDPPAKPWAKLELDYRQEILPILESRRHQPAARS